MDFGDEIRAEMRQVRQSITDAGLTELEMRRELDVLDKLDKLPEKFWLSLPRRYDASETYHLVSSSVDYGLNAFKVYGRTKRERQAKSKRMTKLLDDLIEEVQEFGGIYHYNFVDSALTYAHQVAEHEAALVVELDPGLAATDVVNIVGLSVTDAIFKMYLDDKCGFFQHLRGTIERWGDAPQYMAKPNDANAQRLFFLRVATSRFMQAFSRPMRSQTLELASLFFDCSDIAEADLSRLAPVQKR